MTFDDKIDRRGSNSSKWDMMESIYGVSAEDGLAMWVADMDFRPPQVIQDGLSKMLDHGIYGYFGDETKYLNSIEWWMKNRHNWDIPREGVFTTHGLVHGTAMCIEAFTKPNDGVILFTPVYHSFAKVILANNREVIEMPLVNNNGRYEMDFIAYEASVPDNAKMILLCSPHNPGGRVWSLKELQTVADFAIRHDLILVSDEIHHDLTYGVHHTPMALIDGISDRLIMMTAATKTFNIAGGHTGNVIIKNSELQSKFSQRAAALGISPNSFGLHMTTEAYSPEGAIWVDDLMEYLGENKKIFEEGVNSIPGVKSMPLEATYLAWVDFSDTGMSIEEVIKRVQEKAKIATNHGPTFGTGGETFLRFNIGMTRANILKAVDNIKVAFSDLQ